MVIRDPCKNAGGILCYSRTSEGPCTVRTDGACLGTMPWCVGPKTVFSDSRHDIIAACSLKCNPAHSSQHVPGIGIRVLVIAFQAGVSQPLLRWLEWCTYVLNDNVLVYPVLRYRNIFHCEFHIIWCQGEEAEKLIVRARFGYRDRDVFSTHGI